MGSGVFGGWGRCATPPLWPDRRDFFKDELSRLRTAKFAQVTRSVLFSLKCTRNRMASFMISVRNPITLQREKGEI